MDPVRCCIRFPCFARMALYGMGRWTYRETSCIFPCINKLKSYHGMATTCMLWAHTLLSLPCIYCIASSAYGLVYLSDDSSVSWYPFPSHTMVKRCATYGSLSLLLSLVPGHIISPTWLGVIQNSPPALKMSVYGSYVWDSEYSNVCKQCSRQNLVMWLALIIDGELQH